MIAIMIEPMPCHNSDVFAIERLRLSEVHEYRHCIGCEVTSDEFARSLPTRPVSTLTPFAGTGLHINAELVVNEDMP